MFDLYLLGDLPNGNGRRRGPVSGVEIAL